MKRIILALFTVTLLGTAFQDARAIGAYASWWNMDALNDDGFGIGVRQPIKIVPIFSIDTRAAWVNFAEADTKVFPLEAVGIVSLGLLYGGLGVGYYLFDVGDEVVNIENSFGWHVLAGVNLGVSTFSVFGEVKWTELEADFKDIDPNLGNVPTSLDAAGVGFNVGVLLGI
jgi:hypothetical protein